MPPWLSRHYGAAESHARPRLIAWGRFVSRNQIAVLLGVAIAVCVILSSPVVNFFVQKDFQRAVGRRREPIGLRLTSSLALYEDEPCWSRIPKERSVAVDSLWVTSEAHLSGTASEHGALERSTLHETLRLQERLQRASSDDANATCIRDVTGACAILSPMAAWRGSESDMLSDPTPLDTLSALRDTQSANGLRSALTTSWPGLQSHSSRQVHKADFLSLSTFQEGLQRTGIDVHGLTGADSYVVPRAVAIRERRLVLAQPRQDSKRTAGQQAEDLVYLMVYAIVGSYVYFRLRQLDRVHSKSGLVLTSLVETAMSGMLSLQICSRLGLPLDLVPWQFMPFLVVVLGVDNIFVITQAVSETSIELALPDRVGVGFSKVGLPIFITFLGEIALVAFAFVCSPPDSSWREIRGFALVALITDYILQSTFFLTVLSIDMQRLELADLLQQGVSLRGGYVARRGVPFPETEKPADSSLAFLTEAIVVTVHSRLIRTYAFTIVSLLSCWLSNLVRQRPLQLFIVNIFYYLSYGANALSQRLCHTSQALKAVSVAQLEDAQLWKALNPSGVSHVHILLRAPRVIAVGASGAARVSRVPSRMIHALNLTVLKRTLLPTAAVTFCLYWLLVYLIKDADLLATEKARAAKSRADEEQAARERREAPRALIDNVFTLSELDIELIAVAGQTIVTWTALDTSLAVYMRRHLYSENALSEAQRIFLDLEGVPVALALSIDGSVAMVATSLGHLYAYSTTELCKLGHVTLETRSRLIGLESIPDRDPFAGPPRTPSETDGCPAFLAIHADGTVFRVNPANRDNEVILGPSPSAPEDRPCALLCSPRSVSPPAEILLLRREIGSHYNLYRIGAEASQCGSLQIGSPVFAAAAMRLTFTSRTILAVVVGLKDGSVALFNGESGSKICDVHRSPSRRIRSLRLAACPSSTCQRCGDTATGAILVAFADGTELVIKRIYQPLADKGCRCRDAVMSPPMPRSPMMTPTKLPTDDGMLTALPSHSGRKSSVLREKREVAADLAALRTPPVSPIPRPRSASSIADHTDVDHVRVTCIGQLAIEAGGVWDLVGRFLTTLRKRNLRDTPPESRDGILGDWELASLDLGDPNNELPVVRCDPLVEHVTDLSPSSLLSTHAGLRRRRDPLKPETGPPRRRPSAVQLHAQLPFARGRHFTLLPGSKALVAIGNSVAFIDASALAWQNGHASAEARPFLMSVTPRKVQ